MTRADLLEPDEADSNHRAVAGELRSQRCGEHARDDGGIRAEVGENAAPDDPLDDRQSHASTMGAGASWVKTRDHCRRQPADVSRATVCPQGSTDQPLLPPSEIAAGHLAVPWLRTRIARSSNVKPTRFVLLVQAGAPHATHDVSLSAVDRDALLSLANAMVFEKTSSCGVDGATTTLSVYSNGAREEFGVDGQGGECTVGAVAIRGAEFDAFLNKVSDLAD
jgi:hypothetical protein